MQKRATALRVFLWPMLLMAIAAPVSAHHSFAGYDMSKTSNAQATIKEFRWGAPHSAAVFVIKGSDGKQQEVTVASAAPSMFVKQGFKPKDFRVGDKVEISWHPSRSGATGGILSTLKLPDGRVFKDTEFAAINAAEAAKTAAPPAQ
ncbi:MAG TPA: DUF6152 family protein [Steroidobacter sp.]